MKKFLFVLLAFSLIIPIDSVFAQVDTETIAVLSRGHIQDLGDYPTDGSFVTSPNRIGTVGQSKRIEGFELKPTNTLPADIELRYNVHVQNIGWLYDETDPTTWAKNGDYAGTRGDGLRIEAIKIVLLDATGNKATGYHVHYQGHVQDVGDLPADSSAWVVDGEQLGTVGSSLRLEALKLEIVKDASMDTDLSAYSALLKQTDGLSESDYTKTSWANLQTVLKSHVVTDKNTAAEVAGAVKAIEAAIQQLEKLSTSTVYDKAGTYGPTSGSETISQDVIITATEVTLQNLTIEGNLIIDEAVGDGDVTLNNVTVSGELRVRGGGKNSIHINGGDYQNILVEKTPTGVVRIVVAGLDGIPFVLSEDAAGQEVILEGNFDSVTVNAPDAVVKTDKQTSIKQLNIAPEAKNSTVNLGSQTTVTDLSVKAPVKVTGTGTVSKAEIASNNVSFEKAPGNYTVDPEVVIPPVIPKPTPQPQPGGDSGGGYTPPSKISLSVTTAPTVTLTKTYDGTTATDVASKVLDATAVTGIISDDNVTVSATATYDNKNVGNNKDITVTYSLSGTNANKYNPPAATTIKGEITQKPLSSATTTAIAKEFDGTTTLNTVITEALGQVNADTLTITRTATYQNSSGKTDAIEVGTDKPVTCSYKLSGTDAGNYSAPAEHPGTGTITKKNLTVSAASLNINKSKTYDGTTDVYDNDGKTIATGNNVMSVATGVAADPNINVTVTAVYDNQNAGSNNRSITVSYTIDSNPANKRYQIAAMETLSGSITARPLTIVAPTPVAKAYDGSADVFTAANNTNKIYNLPVIPGNTAAGDADKVTVKATATYDAGKDVGTNKKITIRYTLSGDAAGNYQPLPDDYSKKADITPLTLNTGSVTEKTKEYDGTSTATKLKIPLSCSNNNGVFQDEAGKTLSSKIVADYYTDNECKTKCSQVGDNLYIKYTISLDGASAGNYVFEGGEKTLTATTNGGSITPKTLTIAPPTIKTSRPYDGTSKVYDPDGKEISSYAVAASQISGLAVGESVAVTANLSSNDKDAGEQTVTISYSTSDNSGNYLIANQTITVTITPLQLTFDTSKLPAIAETRKYDATTDVYLANSTTKLSDYPLAADAVSGLINNDAVTVKATASYDNKNISSDGSAKPVTIHFTLDGEAAKNYLAPDPDTSKTAAITPRILGYANVTLVTMKKADGSSSVTFISTPKADSTKANSMDGVAYIDGIESKGQEDVHLETYSADYYDSSNNKTSTAGSDYTIKLSGSLTGNHASNYLMTDYTYSQKGQILAANAVISTPYNNTAWTPAGTLTPPSGVSDFKLFYAKQAGTTTTFYGYDSNGKIYSSTDLSTWTNGTLVTLDGSKALIGIDSSGYPLAIATTPDTDQAGNTTHSVYTWSGNRWNSYDSLPNIIPGPINPTFYTDANLVDYLIYQDNNNNVTMQEFFEYQKNQIGSNSSLSLPSSFTNSLLVYNGSGLTLYAY
ncbi:YDG domain-containing protein [uncultured Acetobacterium sp.]|uniref:YDG domain-containing protein n=1 Tax=uncultured Acetobacterium sp. TaxID=217139 RepID=UPI0025E92CD8|nr:YDG domain-containing protein [uncultured Acetobacterium sp.]